MSSGGVSLTAKMVYGTTQKRESFALCGHYVRAVSRTMKGCSDRLVHSRTTACHKRGKLVYGVQDKRFETSQTENGKGTMFADNTVGTLLAVEPKGVTGQSVAGQALISSRGGVLNNTRGSSTYVWCLTTTTAIPFYSSCS